METASSKIDPRRIRRAAILAREHKGPLRERATTLLRGTSDEIAPWQRNNSHDVARPYYGAQRRNLIHIKSDIRQTKLRARVTNKRSTRSSSRTPCLTPFASLLLLHPLRCARSLSLRSEHTFDSKLFALAVSSIYLLCRRRTRVYELASGLVFARRWCIVRSRITTTGDVHF